MKPEGFKLDCSLLNSLSLTPIKNNSSETKNNIPSYNLFKEQAAKIASMPHFIPFGLNTKENHLRAFNDTFDSQQIYEEICGKKRARTPTKMPPPDGVMPDAALMNSLIYSPSKIRYAD